MLGMRACQRMVLKPVVQFSTKAKPVSSIPVINLVIESQRTPQMCLVNHPYKLDGYKAPDAPPQVVKNLFAVVDFSGTQYKVIDVSLQKMTRANSHSVLNYNLSL